MKSIVNFFIMLLGSQEQKNIVIEQPRLVRQIRHRTNKPKIYNYR
jgi:hypothetical protein